MDNRNKHSIVNQLYSNKNNLKIIIFWKHLQWYTKKNKTTCQIRVLPRTSFMTQTKTLNLQDLYFLHLWNRIVVQAS